MEIRDWLAGRTWPASGYNFVGRAAKHSNIFPLIRIVGRNVWSKANSIQHLIEKNCWRSIIQHGWPNGRTMLDRAKLERWIQLFSIVWPGLKSLFSLNFLKRAKMSVCAKMLLNSWGNIHLKEHSCHFLGRFPFDRTDWPERAFGRTNYTKPSN